MEIAPSTDNFNATATAVCNAAFCIRSDINNNSNNVDDVVDNNCNRIAVTNDTLTKIEKCKVATESNKEEEQETEMEEERIMQQELEHTEEEQKDNTLNEHEWCYEQRMNSEFDSPVINNNDVVEPSPELTLANVPVCDGRVELPNAASIGGHHLSLTEGRIFMKQSCSKREERFYELIKSYQEELVERAIAHASSVIHQYLQKGVPDALEQSFNMYIEREHRQKERLHEQHHEEYEMNKDNNKTNHGDDASVCKSKEKNEEPHRSNSSICNKNSITSNDVAECASCTKKAVAQSCSCTTEEKELKKCEQDNELLTTSIRTEQESRNNSDISLVGEEREEDNGEDAKRKLTSVLVKTASGVRASNVSLDELNKCGSGQSVANGSFNSVSLYDNSTLGESGDNVLARESVKDNIKDSAELMKQRREKKIAATLWWTIMAHEYQGNEENRESTLSDIGAINSGNGNGNVEPIEFLSSTPTDFNVLGQIDSKKEFDRSSSAVCGCGHLSTHSSTNALCREEHNNMNVNESSTTSSFIRTWQQNNGIDDGHYETTYEVQRQVMNNGSFASNITSNTNLSSRAMGFRSPTTTLPQAMRSPSMNSHKAAMFDVQIASPSTTDAGHAQYKESPLQGSDSDGLNNKSNRSMCSCQDTNNTSKGKSQEDNTTKINLSNDSIKTKDNEEWKALADSRGSNAPQDECASVITTYSSVSARPTAAEVEKARALHWLAPFVPRYFEIRKVRLSTITELGVPRVCLNGWSVDSKDIEERAEQAAASKIKSKSNEQGSKSASTTPEHNSKSGENDAVDTHNADLNNANTTETQTASLPEVDIYQTEYEMGKSNTTKTYNDKNASINNNNGSTRSNNSSRKSSALRATRRKKTPLRFRFSISSIPQSTRKKGVSSTNKKLNDPYCEMIAMEDVCYHFAHPCVLDMKMGSRQYGLHPTATKKKSKEKKSLQSTSAKYGIRLAGYRRWNEQTQTYDKKSKLECRCMTLTELKKELYTFLQENRQMEHMFRKQVENLRVVFSKQTIFRFYTSSLLFVYDADDPLKTGRIVMVDFAYTYEKDELVQDNDPEASFAYDVGYLKALDTLLSLLA